MKETTTMLHYDDQAEVEKSQIGTTMSLSCSNIKIHLLKLR